MQQLDCLCSRDLRPHPDRGVVEEAEERLFPIRQGSGRGRGFFSYLENRNFSLLSLLHNTTVAPSAARKCMRYGSSMVLPTPGVPVHSMALSADTV